MEEKEKIHHVGEELWIMDDSNIPRKYCIKEVEIRNSGGDVNLYYYHFDVPGGTSIRREAERCFESDEDLLLFIKEMIDNVKVNL